MIKKWIVSTYKINEAKRVESNLSNQKFDYYLPRITTKKINSNPKVEVLFPGYIFINTSFENYSALKYTKGIKNIIRFGDKISHMTDEEIKIIKEIEELSKSEPLVSNIRVNQKAIVKKGSFKGLLVRICSLPKKDRVNVFLIILGSKRKVSILEKDLLFQ